MMVINEITLSIASDAFLQHTVILEGSKFTLVFKYNSRDEFWYITISDESGIVLSANIRLIPYVDLLRKKQILSNGFLMIGGSSEQVTFASLGSTHKLYYVVN